MPFSFLTENKIDMPANITFQPVKGTEFDIGPSINPGGKPAKKFEFVPSILPSNGNGTPGNGNGTTGNGGSEKDNEEKKNKFKYVWVIVVALIVMILGLGGYIIFKK